ncbi:hypothetical protein [Pseudomonas sp. GL-RE-29]|uniref:hypothetical protein n=1 Tax=Pseudomonas sp. GL-RE-29 TaxID=2832375 RepID=UPI001CC09C05|nr:hypothetical protein [Pseudomonas sp. GL-RE-29]
MNIKLSPQRRDDTLEVSRAGATLIINGEAFDFSKMADGDSLPTSAINSPWFAGQVDNVGGELELTLILPLPVNYSPEQAFPVPLENVPNGPVVFPAPLPEPSTTTAPEVVE